MHIILASIGIALPVIMLLAEYVSIRFNDKDFELLSKRISIAFVILFALGTASGTLVALELLLVWPKFMAFISQVAILPFYIEVFAFFMESIFIGIYIYSWGKFRNRMLHLASGIPIAVGGALSAVLITMINAFMNTPNGFDVQAYLKGGTITGVMPFAVFSTPSTALEVSHVLATAYLAGILIFVAYMAFMLSRTGAENSKRYYRKAIRLAMVVGIIALAASIVTGLMSISALMHLQPEKFAAIEGNIYPQSYAPERIGGIPVNGSLEYYIALPSMQSILATGSASGAVPGLSSYPRSTWPPLIIHLMFDLMFGAAVLLGLIFAYVVLQYLIKRRPLYSRLCLWLLMLSGLLSVFALEDGWIMEELGRQPWIIYNVMLVSQAANQAHALSPVAMFIFAFYIAVLPATVFAILRIFKGRPLEGELASR